MVVWGDDEVIQAWATFKKSSDEGAGIQSVIAMEDVLFAIRRSMGHSNKALGRGDLLSLFVNDIHVKLPKSKTWE